VNLRKLQRKLRRTARRELRQGFLNPWEYESALEVAKDSQALQELSNQIETEGLNPWQNPKRFYGAGFGSVFSNFWDWFLENWPEILEIVLKIAPMFLENQDADS
jgi:hypothetical protein